MFSFGPSVHTTFGEVRAFSLWSCQGRGGWGGGVSVSWHHHPQQHTTRWGACLPAPSALGQAGPVLFSALCLHVGVLSPSPGWRGCCTLPAGCCLLLFEGVVYLCTSA